MLSLRTKRPTGKFDGMVQGTLGDRGRVEGRGAVDFPILEGTLSGRVSLLYKDYDGYWYNDTLHRRSVTTRSRRVAPPSSTTRAASLMRR